MPAQNDADVTKQVPSWDIDSVGNRIYSFQKTCSFYISRLRNSSNEQSQSSWVTLSDLTLCVFTYWEKQIVDYNCSRFIFQFCVCFAANVVLFICSFCLMVMMTAIGRDLNIRQNALQLIRCLRTVVTEKSPRKRQVTKQGERNSTRVNSCLIDWHKFVLAHRCHDNTNGYRFQISVFECSQEITKRKCFDCVRVSRTRILMLFNGTLRHFLSFFP